MAAPSLIALTTVFIKTAVAEATTSMADLIAAVATGSAINIEAIYCSNIHASVSGWITVVHKRSGTEYKIVNQMRVGTNTMLNAILGKPFYLEEGDSLRIQANAVSNIVVFVPYSIVT